jgi:type I restriction enzyme S subunit
VFLATPNLKGRNIDFGDVNYINEVRYNESPEIKLNEGDVLLAKDGSTLGTVNVVRVLPRPATVNSSIAVITPRQRLDSLFLYYLFQSLYLSSTIDQIKGGMGVPHLFQEDLNKFYLPLPPELEQSSIAAFLDRETAKIDALVEEQKRLIELLKEKRQAIITHAVTKGLDPSAPMKPSGIEWLGDVPEHWKVTKIKHVAISIEQGWSPQCEEYPVGSQEEWGILKVGCVNGGTFNPVENKALPTELEPLPELGIAVGDVLISRANTRELVGSAAAVRSAFPNLLLCDKLYRLRLNSVVCAAPFLSFYLGTGNARSQIEAAATGASSSMLNIGQSVILELQLALPMVSEQAEILRFIDVETTRLNELMRNAVMSIELMQERRSALISAAVTGKIDVRGEAKNAEAA